MPDDRSPANLKRMTKFYEGKGAVMSVVEPNSPFATYWETLHHALVSTVVTREVNAHKRLDTERELRALVAEFRKCHDRKGTVHFIGNGGSAGIATHMAVDYSKNGRVRSRAMHDGAMLTCLANDFGYQNVFAKQLEWYGRKGDIAVIISTSGRSLNIIAAADAAREARFELIVTLTGMNPNNLLRAKGDLNFYVPCMDYGIVEIAHLTLLHSMIGRG